MHNATPALYWTDAYSVNVAALDLQHQGLFDTINELNDSMAEGHGEEVMTRVLEQLFRYAGNHFEAEETLMERYGFPGLHTHRVEHEGFARNVAKYMEDFRSAKPGAPVFLLMFLQSWLKEHILKTDKAYSKFLNEHGIR